MAVAPKKMSNMQILVDVGGGLVAQGRGERSDAGSSNGGGRPGISGTGERSDAGSRKRRQTLGSREGEAAAREQGGARRRAVSGRAGGRDTAASLDPSADQDGHVKAAQGPTASARVGRDQGMAEASEKVAGVCWAAGPRVRDTAEGEAR